MKSQLHYLSAAHCAAPVIFGSELLLLVGHNSSLMMRLPWLCMISPLAMMCAFTAMYVYPIVDEVLPKSYA